MLALEMRMAAVRGHAGHAGHALWRVRKQTAARGVGAPVWSSFLVLRLVPVRA